MMFVGVRRSQESDAEIAFIADPGAHEFRRSCSRYGAAHFRSARLCNANA